MLLKNNNMLRSGCYNNQYDSPILDWIFWNNNLVITAFFIETVSPYPNSKASNQQAICWCFQDRRIANSMGSHAQQ